MKTTDLKDPAVERIRTTLDRMRNTVEKRPARALGTARTRVRVVDGLTCEAEERDERLTIDMPERWGGNGQGPNPGMVGRSALGACLAMSYLRWAAAHDLPIRSLEIEIEADFDARAELGVGDGNPAYTGVRYVVSVNSDAPEEEVRRVFDLSDARCPYLHIWQDPIDVRRELRIEAP
jgi:uncharacterized OsmC-like protein